uniref:Uncharacterized protein n=1 Tax=Oryza meridionalis TaxID=40149 RepID=A0A0E0EKG5_9ORYZ
MQHKSQENLAASTMFDDDDDVEPPVNDVDIYYFEEREDKPVCFSVLPIKFDENEEVSCSDYKELNLRGFTDNNRHVFKKVIAWRLDLDCQRPKISVLSSDGKWIELLKPRMCYYEKKVRSILITVQMLHFVRKCPKKQERSLFDHLGEVFNKFGPGPNGDDIKKHHHLIKLFMERDPILVKSKIIRCFIGDASRKAIEPIPRRACEGPCKRSFHARVKHGRKSKCRTLRFTSAELKLKESGTFLCENCEHNEHQCFKCGELEPSYGPNAKVFQCNKESCGHFYHPKCIAVLLEPEDTDGACKLEEMIADGMSFTCPVHWCFKCAKMEDRTRSEFQFAVCRRCPRSYHTECLPRHHGIDATTGTPSGEHIKFPSIPKIKKTKNLSKKDAKVTGKRKKSGNKFSTKSTKLANVSPRGESKQTRRVARNSSSEHIALEHGCAVKRLKKDLQFEVPLVDVSARLSGAKTVEGKEGQPGTPSSFVMGEISKSASCAVDGETEKRVTSTAEKEISAGTSQDMATKGVLRQPRIEIDGLSECSVQIADKLHWYVQPGNTIVDLCFNMDNFSRLMKEKLEDVSKRCNFKNYDLFQHKNNLCFDESNWVTMQPKDLPHGLNLVMVLDLPLDIQTVSANKFVDKVLPFKPRLIIIVSPTDIERLDCKEEPYHLIWEYNQHIFGKPLYQPGDVDVNDDAKNGLHVIPLSVSLWSCPDKTQENMRIAGKHGHLNVGHKAHSVMLKDSSVDKGAKGDNEIFTVGKEDTSEREQTSEHCSGEQLIIPNVDTFHANQEQNDELQSLYKEKHANGSGGKNNLTSGKQSDVHRGENACGHNSAARQETEISKRENRMTDSTHEENIRPGKEKIPRDDSNKGTVKPDLVDGLPPDKHVDVAFMHKTTTKRVDTRQECGYNVAVDVDGSYALQHEPKSPHRNDILKGIEMDTSGDNSRKTREQKEVTDAKRLDLDRKREAVHMKNTRDGRHEDDRTAHPQCVDIKSPSHNDDQRARGASVCKSRERGASNRILESRDTVRKNSARRQVPVERRNGHVPYSRRPDYSATARRGSPSYPRRRRRSRHFSSERYHSTVHPRGNSPDTKYDGYGYHGMDTLPVDRYYPQEHHNGAYRPQTNFGEEEQAAVYGRRRNDHGWGPDYRRRDSFDWEYRSSARGTVTDRYVPDLEQTNHQIPGQASLQDGYFLRRSRSFVNMHVPY